MNSALKDDYVFSENNFISLLGKTSHMLAQYVSDRFKGYGLKSHQHIYLTIVARNPGISQKTLVSSLSIDASNVTRNLVTLEANGFIYRETDPDDKRGLLLFPTEKTRSIIEELENEFMKIQDDITSVMTQQELQTLISVLVRICEKVESTP